MRSCTSIACLFMGLNVYSQSDITLGASIFHGGMLDGEVIVNLIGSTGTELRASRYTDGKSPWEAYHGYPKLEFGLTYINYGVPDIYGHLIAGMVGLNYPLAGKHLRWSPGFGIGYSSKYFAKNNQDNRAVSTRISLALEFDFIYEISSQKGSVFELFFGLRHTSNGNIKKPNHGMNIVAGGIAYQYSLKPELGDRVAYKNHAELNKISYNILYTIGWKDIRSSPANDLYRVQSISFFMAYRFSNLNSFTLGLDGFLDTSLFEEYIYQRGVDPPFGRNFDQKQLAFNIGNTFHFGKLSIVTMAGFFLYRPYKFRSLIYQRWGFNYLLADRIILHSALKAYSNVAEVIEFGVGVKL